MDSSDHVDNNVSGGTFYGPVVQARVVHLHGAGQPAGPGQVGLPLHDLADPLALNVHRSIDPDPSGGAGLPAYVERPHDATLREAVRRAVDGTSTVAALVGGSSTGKTRSCWEALRELPSHWRIWHPLTLARLCAALRTPGSIAPHTLLWLDETQSYLLQPSSPDAEEAAVGLRALLSDPGRGPVLVLGTLWPEYWALLDEEQHRHARALLTGRGITVPHAFTERELARLADLASHDGRLREAAERAQDGEIAQYLAGAPMLLERYDTAPPTTRAVIEAAMDLRRLGHGLDLPLALLAAAAPAYLTRSQRGALAPDWWDQAVGRATAPCNGAPGPLDPVTRTPGNPSAAGPDLPRFRLADYLEQYGHRTREHHVPGPAFWEAAVSHAAATDAAELGRAAELRLRLRHAALLYQSAYEAGSTDTLYGLARLRERVGSRAEAERLAQQAASDHDMSVYQLLARMREEAGEPDEAARLYRANIEAGSSFAPWDLAWLLERHGDPAPMRRLLAQALRSGDYDAQLAIPWLRMGATKHPTLDELVHDAAARSSVVALWAITLASQPQEAEQAPEPEPSARRSADAGHSAPLEALARRHAADPSWRRLLRYGLEPGGETSHPWE